MSRTWWNLLTAVALFAMFAVVELAGEDEAISLSEFLLEDAWPWVLLAAAITAAIDMLQRYRNSLDERADLSQRLFASQVEGARWRAAARHASEGLSEAIRGQFADWRLSPSEADVAMLMLKGLSHKEVARLRQASPATVRQQATAVYQKSGLGSRAALAAFFLEDLFPAETASAPFKSAQQASPGLMQQMS